MFKLRYLLIKYTCVHRQKSLPYCTKLNFHVIFYTGTISNQDIYNWTSHSINQATVHCNQGCLPRERNSIVLHLVACNKGQFNYIIIHRSITGQKKLSIRIIVFTSLFPNEKLTAPYGAQMTQSTLHSHCPTVRRSRDYWKLVPRSFSLHPTCLHLLTQARLLCSWRNPLVTCPTQQAHAAKTCGYFY